MYYVLHYKTVPDYVEKRTPFRAEHLALAQKMQQEGTLYMGGALSDPADEAILVFKSDSPQSAEDFAKNDPYVKNGVVVSWTVRPWNVVIGG